MRATVLTLVMLLTLCFSAAAPAQVKILFMSKSQGFEHSPVAEKDGKPSVAAKVLTDLGAQHGGAQVTATKNGSAINAENLKNYQLVIFYSQGDLTQPSKDGGDNMGPDGVKDLLDWISAGGAVMGFHSASDTFHPTSEEGSPFLKMMGAEFETHGAQFKGNLKVVDTQHPAMANYPPEYMINEEWYLFKDFNKNSMHILAVMDPGEEGAKQEKYKIAPYPVIWCSQYGNGKVFFSALGHNDEMWLNEDFQKTIVDAADWVLSRDTDPAQVAPNWDKVMSKFATK